LNKKGSRRGKLMNKKRCPAIIVIMAAAVLLLASSCTTPTNHLPIITSLETEAEWTVALGSLQVMCTASDPDGDELSYNWLASGGNITGTGSEVTWTAPLSEGSYNVTVTVTDGRGGEVGAYLTITVRANESPTITSLIADAVWTTPSGSLQVTCAASDPDGDELSYEWAATAGAISGTGAVVNWTAPQEVGTYDITVVVKDGHGSSATDLLPISVVTGQPPVIETLLITKDRYGHCYLKKSGEKYLVGKEKKYDIECIASNTSGELVYEWSCTGGNISGEGSLITWTAPNTEGDVTVTVTVFDIAGNMASKDIILNVVPCSYCIFGC
jgi:hypothetical protein